MAAAESNRIVWMIIGAIALIAAVALGYLFFAGGGQGLIEERGTVAGAVRSAGEDVENVAQEAGAAIERAGEKAREDRGTAPPPAE